MADQCELGADLISRERKNRSSRLNAMVTKRLDRAGVIKLDDKLFA